MKTPEQKAAKKARDAAKRAAKFAVNNRMPVSPAIEFAAPDWSGRTLTTEEQMRASYRRTSSK